MTVLRGFDVSSYQGAEPWQSFVTKYGISYGFAKATEGLTWNDPTFAANWAGMAAAGIVRGAYHFAHPRNDPVAEAKHFLNVVKPSLDTDLLLLDLEVSELDAAGTRNWTIAWADAVTSLTAGKYNPGLYNGGYMQVSTSLGWRNHFGYWMYPNPITKYDNGSWPSAISPPNMPRPNNWGGLPDFWQFSWAWPAQQGDPHDASIFNGDLARLRSLNANTGVDMTDANVISIADPAAAAIWGVGYGSNPDGSKHTVGQFLQAAAGRADDAARNVDTLTAKVDALTATVDGLVTGTGLTSDQIVAAIKKAIIDLFTGITG